MRKLTPTKAEIAALRKTAPAGPMIAINLLKFKAEHGLEAYGKYIEAGVEAASHIPKILFSGVAGPDFGGGEDWDYVIIVEFESAEAFANAITNVDYQERAVPYRQLALERTLWMPAFPSPMNFASHQPQPE